MISVYLLLDFFAKVLPDSNNWNEKALNFGDSWARYLLAVMCLEGSLEEIFPDKVTRGMCYMEMAAKGNFPQAVEFMEKQKH